MAQVEPSTEITTTSRLLELPAELRNVIYELVLTPDNSEVDGKLDLLTAEPPSKNLLLVCHQIYKEASQIYKTAYRAFWSTSDFTLTLKKKPELERFAATNTEDINHINSLDVTDPFRNYVLLDKRGGWRYICSNGKTGLVWYDCDAEGEWPVSSSRVSTDAELESLYNGYRKNASFHELVMNMFFVDSRLYYWDEMAKRTGR